MRCEKANVSLDYLQYSVRSAVKMEAYVTESEFASYGAVAVAVAAFVVVVVVFVVTVNR